MSEGIATEQSLDSLKHDTLHISVSEPHLDALHLTVKEPVNCRGGSPLSRNKKGTVGGSLARALRKVFRSRTPSPSTDEREEDANSESEEIKFEEPSDSEHQDGLQMFTTPPNVKDIVDGPELTTLSGLNNNSIITISSEDSKCNSSKDFMPIQSPGLGKSQTYSALSEALHHAFLEGMVCSGAEDISLLSSEELHSQGSKSDSETGTSRSIEYCVNHKSTNCMLSEVRENLRKTLETPLHHHSLLVPTLCNTSKNYSEPSDIGTDDDSSSHHSQEEKQECHFLHENEHRSVFGNFFSSRRPSLVPPTDDTKTEVSASQPSPKFKPKEGSTTPSHTEQGKGHKKLGDRLSKVAEVSTCAVDT